MALFTDGPPSSIEDLSAQDSQLLDVANVEGIDVTQKLALAWDEVGLELYTVLNLLGTAGQMLWQPPRPTLGSVVVTNPLKLWHTYRALEIVYIDAYNCQLNDRYAGKRDQYHEQAVWAKSKLREVGIGIANLPISRASKPLVSASPSGLALPDGTYYVSMAWVNRNGEEGAASELADITTTGNTFAAQAGTAPQNAIAWNVYAGSDPCALTLQNPSPIAAGQAWIQTSPMAQGARAPGSGQAVSFLKILPQILQRG